MPLLSRVAVPVVRPAPLRKVCIPLLSVVTVVEMRPLASRKVVCCALAKAISKKLIAMTATSPKIIRMRVPVITACPEPARYKSNSMRMAKRMQIVPPVADTLRSP